MCMVSMVCAVRPGRARRVVFGLVLALGCVAPALADDIREFVHETQQLVSTAQQMTMVWWIPAEFWDLSMASNPNVTPQIAQQVREAFHDYQVFALLHGNVGLQGLTDTAPRADLLANSRLQVGDKVIAPLAADQVPSGVQAILGAMRPLLSGMLGKLGQSMELVVYPAAAGGQRLNDPKANGAFQFVLYDQTFRWRTPLASLLPKKVDPKSKEEFPGNYLYNPYTGDRLSTM